MRSLLFLLALLGLALPALAQTATPVRPSLLVLAMVTTPSSEISMVVLVSSVNARITEPPLPITSRILSGLIFMVNRRGAKFDTSVLASLMASCILPRMCIRASLA